MNFADRDGVIWLDGNMVPWRDAKVHLLTHTLHYGMGVFEGIRVYETANSRAVFRLEDHIQRLLDSAKLLQMEVQYSLDDIIAACIKVIEENQLAASYIRPMLFYGSEGMGLHADNLKTHLMIATWPWGAYLGSEGLSKGIRTKVSTFRRIHQSSLLTKAKACGHYMNSMLALKEVSNAGYDEAIMLDDRGFIAEGSGENFFCISNGEVITPNPDAILLGITRDTIMTLCRDNQITVSEANISRDQAYLADEAFFTGTAAEVTPIREIDDRTIGNGGCGPITTQLQSQYFAIVKGEQSEYQHWLTVVD